MTDPQPKFWVREIPIYGDLILSPMDGISDHPFRALARSLGSAMSYTEFLNAQHIMHKHVYLSQHLAFSEDERPVVYQLFDDQPERLVAAAVKILDHHPDIIDVNMGCSARTVTHRGAGAGLMREPAKIAKIFSLLTKAVNVPVTGKIRLGWDETTKNYLEIAKIIEDNGGSLIAVHARTKEQRYQGTPDWAAIGEIKQAVHLPVVGNGDVRTVADIDRMFSLTGCDAIMIGRAAIDNPWIFSRRDRHEIPTAEVFALMQRHLQANIEFYGDKYGLILFRKYAMHYLSGYVPPREKRQFLMTLTDPAVLLHQLGEYLNSLDGTPPLS